MSSSSQQYSPREQWPSEVLDCITAEAWVGPDNVDWGHKYSTQTFATSSGAVRLVFTALGGEYISSATFPLLPSTVAERSVDLSWLTKLYSSTENMLVSSSQLSNVIVNINLLLKKQRFEDLAFIFASLKLDRLAPEVLLAFARLTFPVRQKIGRWTKFVSNVERSLNSRGLDGKKLLRGLTATVGP